jgi:hypothetical protein
MEQAHARYLQHVESIRATYGDAAALAVRAMASFRFAQLTTLALIEELDRANMLAPDCADTVNALWATAQSQTTQVMLAPLIAGKTDEEASALVTTISEVSKIMAALPLATAACH